MDVTLPIYLPDTGVDRKLDEEIRRLLFLCFSTGAPRFEHQRFNNEMPLHRWLIRDADGRLVAHLATHEKAMAALGDTFSFCGVAEVCVHPDARGGGLVGQMLREAEALHEDCDYSILLGAERVYSRYGYVKVGTVYFPHHGPEPAKSAMVKCLRQETWPEGRVEIPGPHF